VHGKLSAHTQRLNEYSGWQQVLAANPENRQSLDIEDWLFFLGGSKFGQQLRGA
jgi:hypothetical protein